MSETDVIGKAAVQRAKESLYGDKFKQMKKLSLKDKVTGKIGLIKKFTGKEKEMEKEMVEQLIKRDDVSGERENGETT
ncbi:MAG: hypothetical protein GY950_34765 [bacterium]|nr:hypothetical protein [bacterium]